MMAIVNRLDIRVRVITFALVDVAKGNLPATIAINKERDARLGLCFKCRGKGHSMKLLQKHSPTPVKTSREGCCNTLPINSIPMNKGMTTKVSDICTEVVIDAKEFHTRSFKNIIVNQLPSVIPMVYKCIWSNRDN